MTTNYIIRFTTALISVIIIPVAAVTTFFLNILIRTSFGLLMWPIFMAWCFCFYYPLLGLSYLFNRFTFLRPIVAIIGIPIAIAGYAYNALMPSMGEVNSKMERSLCAVSFPYTYAGSTFHHLRLGVYPRAGDVGHTLLSILKKEQIFPQMTAYINIVFWKKGYGKTFNPAAKP